MPNGKVVKGNGEKRTVSQEKMVLIVEDDEVLLRVLYLFLKRADYTIATATDGESAVKMIQRLKPNIILLDLLLPKMDGFEVLRVEKAKALGALDYFVKANTDLSVILEKIKNY